MAGVAIRIDFDDEDVRRALAGLKDAAADLEPAMDEIGGYLTAATQRRFERGAGPDGKAWPPSIRARATGGRTLLDSGRLANSITWRAGRNSVEVGTNVIYAAIHQLGGTIRAKTEKGLTFRIPGVGFRRKASVTIPARPFLGVDRGDRREIADILRDHLAGEAV